MESFTHKYFSTNYEDVNEEVLLERRISPYVTLRPGDLVALLKLHSSLPISLKLNCNHDNSYGYRKIDTLFEKGQLELSPGDTDDEKNCNEVTSFVCRGAEQGHVPAEYKVKGLRRHEFPVIGVFIDKRICPGFQYHVRKVGINNFLWGNKARTLESIGMGYGRRMTFSGDQLNNNDCYFWSDTEPNGYAVSIQAVQVGQKFIIQNSFDTEVGEGIIEKVCAPQEEISMDSGKFGVTKHVRVTIACAVTYYQRHHYGLKELLCPKNLEIISGEAVLSKPRSSRKANFVNIEKVFLPRVGHCKLIPDS
uniref:Uncharacterized protein n=2 Tax=Arion vulgaris TaxID=1028688 RepID=A0A0B6ZCX1_9EUPU